MLASHRRGVLSGAVVEYDCRISGEVLMTDMPAPSDSSWPLRERKCFDMRITHANTPTTITATIAPMTPATIDGVFDFDVDWRGTAVALTDAVLDAPEDVGAVALVGVVDVLEITDVGNPKKSELVRKVSGTVRL